MEPADVTYDADSRHMDVSGTPPGADCFQAVFATDSGKKWNIWSEHAASFDLPPAPPEGDRSESHGFVSIYLGSTTYQELVEFNSTNLADLALIVEAFSYVEMR